MVRTLSLGLVLLVSAGCQSTPPNPNELSLDASEGVKEYFEPGADQAAAKKNIRCEKRRALKSRISKRVCRTEEEWAQQRAPRVLHRWQEVDSALNGGGGG